MDVGAVASLILNSLVSSLTSGANDYSMLILALMECFLFGDCICGKRCHLSRTLGRVISIQYHSRLVLFRCLALSDLFVGLFVEPFRVACFMSVLRERWVIWQCKSDVTFIFGYALTSVSLLIVTAIRLDRFLALRLGLIYRKVVTLKRSILAAIVIWVVSIVSPLTLASKPATGLGQFAAKLKHSCNRPEHSERQGSCLTFSLGASDVMRLLLAICSHWYMATLL